MGYREKCIREKGEECYLCGNSSEIEVHHIDGNRQNNRLNNLIPVCAGCHSSIHSNNDEHTEWSNKYNESDTVSFGPERKKILEQIEGHTLWEVDSEDFIDSILEKALDETYEAKLEMTRKELKFLLSNGWVRIYHGCDDYLLELSENK